jgi:hypothetical protein
MSDGGIVNSSALPGDYVRVDVRLLVDGVVLVTRRHDVENGTFANTGHWSFSIATPLSAGSHTVVVDAMLSAIGRGNPGNPFPAAFVAGTADTVTRGTLTTIVVNK